MGSIFHPRHVLFQSSCYRNGFSNHPHVSQKAEVVVGGQDLVGIQEDSRTLESYFWFLKIFFVNNPYLFNTKFFLTKLKDRITDYHVYFVAVLVDLSMNPRTLKVAVEDFLNGSALE